MSVVWYFYFQSNYFFNVSNGFGFALEKTKLDFHLEITSEFSNSTCHLHKVINSSQIVDLTFWSMHPYAHSPKPPLLTLPLLFFFSR